MANADSSSSSRYRSVLNFRRKAHIYALVVLLCITSYLLAVFHRGSRLTTALSLSAPCNHFSAESSKTFPRCSANFSEYTPCHDPQRSLRYKRSRKIYKERHCPEEPLKCRVPAPHGYRNPFPWPASRDVAWYANVPHRELTVEKAVQNWIRYDGDRFRFPGGGTMFPNGADKYIDDIADLVNLRDGTVRTAVDTGCGVRFFFLFPPFLFVLLFYLLAAFFTVTKRFYLKKKYKIN